MKKRMFSVLLALCMVLTLLPAEALAEEFDELLDRSGTRTEEEDVAGIETEPDAENTVETEPEPDEENTAEPEQNGEVPAEIGAEQDEGASGDGAEDTESGVSPQADGDVVQYTLDNGAVLSVDASTGTVTECVSNGATEVDIPGAIQVVDSGTGEVVETIAVTGIGVSAFNNLSGLTSVTIPEGVTSIGDSAFSGCSGLASVTIPGSVTSIGSSAFRTCSGLTSVTIPESVTSIGEEAFSGCSSLTSVTIPEGVTEIGYRMFYECSSLTSVGIPGSVTSIVGFAFSGCSGLTNMTIPDSVTSIGGYAFKGCTGLTSIILSQNITSINNGLFSSCSNLLDLKIPDFVTAIGASAFSGCHSLTTLDIPDSVISIGSYAFSGCTALEHLRLSSGLQTITPAQNSDGCIFAGCPKLKTVGPGADYNIELGQMSIIPAYLFDFEWNHSYRDEIPSYIESIIIPDSVTSIGANAFRCCRSLTNIDIPDSVVDIKHDAFSRCSGLTSITIPESVTSIGNSAFTYCGNLKNVTIPESVTSMGNGAFENCGELTSAGPIGGGYAIQFGWTKAIPYQAFMYCTSLTSMTISESVTSIGGRAFYGCSGLMSVTIPDSVTSIGDYAFYGCRGLTSVTIPGSVTNIGGSAFYGCSGLTSVTIPDSVTSIGDYAFYGCSGLTNMTIPDSVTSIGSNAFSYCSGLTSVTISGSVTSIGNKTFFGCSGLTNMMIPDSVTSIGDYAFNGCSGLTSVTIPESVTRIGSSAFYSCSGLTSVTIPESVISIGSSAFSGCSSLTSLTIPDSVTSIGNYAFNNVSSDFVLYCYPGSYTETYAKANSVNYELLALLGRTLSLSVLDENGTAVTDGVSVTWYDESGSELGSGLTLSGADPEKSYAFTVALGEALAGLYEQPERQTITPSNSAVREIRLVRKAAVRTLTLSGRVCDQAGAPLSGAEIRVVPAGGAGVETAADQDGVFRAEVPCGVVSITVQKDGYYSRRGTLDLTNETGDSYDAGVYTLAPVQTITDRLTLNVVQRRAAEDPDMAAETPLASLGALRVTLTGGGRPITDFEVQGSVLLFRPGAVSSNETVTVTVTDPSGGYRAASASVTLDGSRVGTAKLTMLQKGGFVLGGVSGPDAELLVFNSAGNCVRNRAAISGLASGAMEPGTYRVVLLQKSGLLGGVSNLRYLDIFGLSAGRDYVLRQITVEDGKTVRLEDCTVPTLDESRISYTIPSGTGVTTSKPGGAVAGELLMVRAFYELDRSKNVSAGSLRIAFPEGIAPLGSSVLIDGKTSAYTYDAAKREINVRVDVRDKAVVWLYCTPERSGSHSIGAFLTLTNGASQPVGTAVVQVENARLEVPERTGRAAGLTASGKTLPGSTVTLYDNDVRVGGATANAAGSWSVSFDLAQPVYSYSYHTIYAVIERSDLTEPITTESVLVTYDKRLDAELKKVTMYNTGDHGAQETVFDFAPGSSAETPYYRMWPSQYPTFTFKAEFSGDASRLSEVYVVTANSTGDETYVKMEYDAVSGTWVGAHDYTSFSDAPVTVTAAYTYGYGGEVPLDEEQLEATTEVFLDASKEVMAALDAELYDAYDCTELTISENSVSTKLIYTDPETNDTQEFGSYSLEVTHIEDAVTESTLTNEGFSFMAEAQLWSRTEYGDGSIMRVYVDLNARTCLTEKTVFYSAQFPSAVYTMSLTSKSFLWGIFDDWGPGELHYEVVKLLQFIPGYGLAASLTEGIAKTYESQAIWRTRLNGNVFTLQTDLDTVLYGILEARCKDTGVRRVPDNVYTSARMTLLTMPAEIAEYEREARKMINEALASNLLWFVLSAVMEKCSANLSTEIANATHELEVAVIDSFLKMILDSVSYGSTISDIVGDIMTELASEKSNVDKFIDGTHNDIRKRLNNLSRSIKASYISCGEPDEGPDVVLLESDIQRPVSRPVTYIADPSGYVYEAVPSNRLEGVTAVISSRSGGVWNAADYDQVNPQVTGADGGYYWDVPQGDWSVSFTKSGYRSADTSAVPAAVGGWLPVPPPQLEVNVGMISTAAPTVKRAAVYTDRAEVEFSQYMDIASVQSALSLTRAGATVSNTVIEPLNAEYNLENTKQYATRFSVTVNGGSLPGGLTISVSANAKNYAGTPLEAAYTSETLTASVRPTEIDSPGLISIGLHETAHIPVVLHPNASGWPLIVESLSPALVSVETPRVSTGTSGGAEISVVGSLPGSGLIRITEPATGLSKTITVDVAHTSKAPAAAVAPVTAVLEDGRDVVTGMKLLYGAKITLRTSTQGASIRYTIDDTCPCAETALFYCGPIELTGAVVLRAAAYKDGVYSETIRLELDVEKTAPSAAVVTAILLADRKTVRIMDPDSVLTGNVTVLAVCYEAGRMMDTAFGKAFENGVVSFSKALGENYVLYFLASDSWIPLCEKVSLKTRSGS